ncbi:bifunctional precorrin-2 dehydrogenase/sirohydrochlorin ferrochelatase [Chloroflexota bacterium]
MKREQLYSYYPVFLNISGKKCVVFGGGQIALRKVRGLLEHGARVAVISPVLCPDLAQLAHSKEIKALHREYRGGDLKGAFVAIAATDNSEINRKVAEEAHMNAILVNVVDDAKKSNFILPSYTRQGDVTIAVSTAGRSPALARKIRAMLEQYLGAEYASLSLLIDEVRTEVTRQGIKVSSDAWQEAIDLDLLVELVRKGDGEKARSILLSHLKRLQNNH